MESHLTHMPPYMKQCTINTVLYCIICVWLSRALDMPWWGREWHTVYSCCKSVHPSVCRSSPSFSMRVKFNSWNLQCKCNMMCQRKCIGGFFYSWHCSRLVVWFAHINGCCQQSRVQQGTNLLLINMTVQSVQQIRHTNPVKSREGDR